MKVTISLYDHTHIWINFCKICNINYMGPASIRSQIDRDLIPFFAEFDPAERALHFKSNEDALAFILRFS